MANLLPKVVAASLRPRELRRGPEVASVSSNSNAASAFNRCIASRARLIPASGSERGGLGWLLAGRPAAPPRWLLDSLEIPFENF